MDEIKITIQNFSSNFEVENVDILCTEKTGLVFGPEDSQKIIAQTVVDIESENNNTRVKFEWRIRNEELEKNDFLFVPETQILFFRNTNQWGAISLDTKQLIRHEGAICYPYISRLKYCILIEDELSAQSITFQGDTIDSVPIDPPEERMDFDDKIEYNSPVYGFHTLRTKVDGSS